MKAVLVGNEDAERVRQQFLFEDALDKTRKLARKSGFVEIPVIESFSNREFNIVEQDMPEFYIPKKTLASFVDIPANEKSLLPAGWQIFGEVIIISLREELENRKETIASALLSIYPECRTVLLDRGIKGKMREPDREIIAGEITETIHKENGCLFKLDTMRIMYSGGNLAEKERMSKLGRGETVVDMFAGVGYFSIPMAVHSKPGKIIAIEINPVSFGYLKENIKLNKVEGIIQHVNGDCSVAAPLGIADRVIMGYLDGSEYLAHGIRALKIGGMLHYHEAVPEAVERRPVERVVAAAREEGRDVEIIELRRVKKYAPGVWHVVVDARVG